MFDEFWKSGVGRLLSATIVLMLLFIIGAFGSMMTGFSVFTVLLHAVGYAAILWLVLFIVIVTGTVFVWFYRAVSKNETNNKKASRVKQVDPVADKQTRVKR